MTREIWAREHLVSYLAGGLTTEERFEIQERLKTDAELAAALEELSGFDAKMRMLFAAAKPPIALEDRVIQTLRRTETSAPRRGNSRSWPVRGLVIAASVLVVLLGGAMTVSLFVAGIVGPMQMAANWPDQRMEVGVVDNTESMEKRKVGVMTISDDPSSVQLGAEWNYNIDRLAQISVPGAVRANEVIGIAKAEKGQGGAIEGLWGARPGGGATAPNAPRNSACGLLRLGKLLGDLDGESKKAWFGNDFLNQTYTDTGKYKVGIKGREPATDWDENGRLANTYLGRSIENREGLASNSGKPPGRSAAEPKKEAPKALAAPAAPTTFSPVVVTGGAASPVTPPFNAPASSPVAEGGPSSSLGTKAPDGKPSPDVFAGRAGFGKQPGLDMGAAKAAVGMQSGFSPLGGLGFRETQGEHLQYSFGMNGSIPADKGDKADKADRPKYENTTRVPTADDSANKAPDGQNKSGATASDNKSGIDKDKDINRALPALGQNPQDALRAPPNLPEPPGNQTPKIDQKQPEIRPELKQPVARRIVIRSGEIEFEVESFDQAVGIIYKVIGQTKAGVISTTNSDKLPNGKMRGTVVVRMPPEELDDFVANLRQTLGKLGELTNQRIGSQDVTKHYTDMESELRGLRVSEERLIVMLKDTKGQLKDLLAVETQLAKTRTSVEKLEGELRYYANLAAMSTLTINLHEKEIRVAASIVEVERVKAGVEVEDVDAAYQATKSAIDEFKGRVFRSELKQIRAGEYNAVLEFEMAPESVGLMRDRLKQIGTFGRLEIDRVQVAKGGGEATRESKIKRGDTQFFVSIYNLANILPRETVNVTIVGGDVPASYAKIRDLIVKLKGNLRDTSLQNTDARNVSAVLDFDIRRVDEPAVQTALAAAGDFLTRTVARQAEAVNVTDSKVRFVLRLVSVGAINARESNNMALAALDVPASFRKVRDAILKVKGHIRVANLQENDRSNISATLDFDVMRTDEDFVIATLTGAGEVLTRSVERRPEGENVTDAKIGFRVSLQSVASIAPRETVTLEIAAADVPAAFTKLREAAGKAKAQIRTAKLNEDENMTGSLDFDVLRSEEDVMLAALTAAGDQLTRQVDRQAGAVNVTDAKVLYQVRLRSAKTIEPREIYAIVLKVDNVSEKLKAFQAAVNEVQGSLVAGPKKVQLPNGKLTATVIYRVPLQAASGIAAEFKKAGEVKAQDEAKNPRAPDGKLAVAQIEVNLSDAEPFVPAGEGFGAQLRNGMSYSLRWLTATISFLVAVLVFVGPWILIGWVVVVLIRRTSGSRTPVAVAAGPAAAEGAKT